MKEQFIIVSLPKGYGHHDINKKFCALCADETFNPNLNYAKRFESKEEAKLFITEIAERKRKDGFFGHFVIWEMLF